MVFDSRITFFRLRSCDPVPWEDLRQANESRCREHVRYTYPSQGFAGFLLPPHTSLVPCLTCTEQGAAMQKKKDLFSPLAWWGDDGARQASVTQLSKASLAETIEASNTVYWDPSCTAPGLAQLGTRAAPYNL